MKGEFVEEHKDHSNINNPNSTTTNMFAKLHQQQQQHQSFHHQPPQPQPQPIFHHPFHVSTTAAPTTTRECQTSEEADSHSHSHEQSRSPTTFKKESHDGASIEVVRRPRGRPPGSKNKPKPPVIITRDSEPSMSPYVLELSAGVDVIESVMRFCRKRGIGLCILNGSGSVSNVTLRQPSTATPGATVTFHGRFDILSISATILPSNSASSSVAVNGLFTLSLAGPQGQVFGGAVVGPLAAATTIYLIAATFSSPSYHRLPLEDEPERTVVASGGGGGTGGRHHSPAAGSSGGGNDSGHPPTSAAGDSCGMAMYSGHIQSDVIWTPTARQPQPPPY